ncbi:MULTISPECIES: THUMP domain-containing class I SAM-dependent RNA methyltransferase [Bacteroides]|jgi:putative N6-adenine-specific DNA methylase|uniref:THUMP domain-containing class I SAM-dependent RNA methyltransferase n=1 Tax=Bacteroides TaxID=816 RepID=UPI00189834E1|nr:MULTISPECIES: THUMP domain-containing protein [Bacteroides]MBU9879957.1 RNA methyltransferase [Bacteroides sp. MSK.20.82]MCE8952571.1 RNA methyltransferase [Bacteroides thetaiotaomicron]MCE8969880.1 RNA methyltransferase [Bacteroides thetaiotaomicron]MCS2743754.1 THUMP domain-containing protein [Bacteroides thetaiotaomicron]MCS2998025.1 THUMP domain-containing protein [Bacteroides thetaiotaomicron]
MSEQFEMIAKTFQGLEEILAEELTTLGANDIQIGRRMVSFTGDKRMMYKANFCLRTAIRILKPIKNFTAKDADEVYNQIQAIPWEEYLDVNKTFAIDAVVFSEEFRHSKFVSYKVKDAIVDYFREKTGKRPSVRINNPDVLLNIHIAQTTCTLSLDSSGESLHRRGYRQEQVEAPLNEVLAAGMVLMTGWRGECDLIDPMCGSGTIPIEAALIARNIAPGVFRKGFAFEKWVDFDSEMFDEIYNDDSQEREFTHKIYGYDNNPKANEIATHNIKAAGVSKDVTLKLQPFQQFEQPQEKSIIVMNPPYGERISTNDLLGLYQMIGERLKHAFVGNEAWVLSYREECFDQIGLKPSKKVPLFNGALECEFRKYEIFDGKYKEFKSQEGEGEEKKETEGNYDTSRPRERKEFKPRGEGEFKPRREGEFKPRREGEFKPRREGEYKPRREGEFKPRKEGDFKPRREEGSFTRDDRDRKPRGEFRGERDSRAPREFRGNREPRIPKKEEE